MKKIMALYTTLLFSPSFIACNEEKKGGGEAAIQAIDDIADMIVKEQDAIWRCQFGKVLNVLDKSIKKIVISAVDEENAEVLFNLCSIPSKIIRSSRVSKAPVNLNLLELRNGKWWINPHLAMFYRETIKKVAENNKRFYWSIMALQHLYDNILKCNIPFDTTFNSMKGAIDHCFIDDKQLYMKEQLEEVRSFCKLIEKNRAKFCKSRYATNLNCCDDQITGLVDQVEKYFLEVSNTRENRLRYAIKKTTQRPLLYRHRLYSECGEDIAKTNLINTKRIAAIRENGFIKNESVQEYRQFLLNAKQIPVKISTETIMKRSKALIEALKEELSKLDVSNLEEVDNAWWTETVFPHVEKIVIQEVNDDNLSNLVTMLCDFSNSPKDEKHKEKLFELAEGLMYRVAQGNARYYYPIMYSWYSSCGFADQGKIEERLRARIDLLFPPNEKKLAENATEEQKVAAKNAAIAEAETAREAAEKYLIDEQRPLVDADILVKRIIENSKRKTINTKPEKVPTKTTTIHFVSDKLVQETVYDDNFHVDKVNEIHIPYSYFSSKALVKIDNTEINIALPAAKKEAFSKDCWRYEKQGRLSRFWVRSKKS